MADRQRKCYGNHRKTIILSLKDAVRKMLKSAPFIARICYPFCQRVWRNYAIPRRCRRLQKEGMKALRRLHDLMVVNNVPYYCDYGTLLGIVRDGGFIKHDDDIDISIEPGKMSATDVLKILMDAGYDFVHGFNYEGRLMEFTVADESGITIDVFFPQKMKIPGKVYGYEPIWEPTRRYPSEKANTVMEYEYVEAVEIKAIEIADTEALIPSNYDEVLVSEYGQWKIPDAKFQAVTNIKHRVLPGFAYRMTLSEAFEPN